MVCSFYILRPLPRDAESRFVRRWRFSYIYIYTYIYIYIYTHIWYMHISNLAPICLYCWSLSFCLGPYLDMLNHDSSVGGSRLSYEYFSNAFTASLDPKAGPVKKGQQVAIYIYVYTHICINMYQYIYR